MNLRIIIGMLIGLVVIQIAGAAIYFFLLQNRPSQDETTFVANSELNQVSNTSPAALTLVTDAQTVKRNETFAVSVQIDTKGRPIEGVDVSLKYDAQFLEPVLVNKLPFVPSRLFSDIPFNAYNQDLGTATMSAITPLNQNYSGSGVIGVITFKAKKSGTATIALQAEPESTVDSNIVSEGKEILGETKNVQIVIE